MFGAVRWLVLALLAGCQRAAPVRVALAPLAGRPGGLALRDGTGAAARFAFPGGLAWDGAGHLFVADSGNDALRRIDVATGRVETVAGVVGPGWTDGTRERSRMRHPAALAWDGVRLYVADTGNGAIRRFDPSTGDLETVVRRGLLAPAGLALAGDQLLVADTRAAAVWAFPLAGGPPVAIAGRPGSPGDADGPRAVARLRAPAGLALGGGRLYLADAGGRSIRQVDRATGAVSTLARNLGQPTAVAFDPGGRIFFADALDETIGRLDLSTGAVSAVAGEAGTVGAEDGLGQNARLAGPAALAWIGAGRLAVADSGSVRVVRVADGAVRTLAGGAPRPGSRDGRGAGAAFRAPHGLAAAGGTIFVADSGNAAVRRVDPRTGEVATLAWGRPLVRPLSVAVAGGSLYVADPWAHAVFRVDPANGRVALLAGGAAGLRDGTGAAARFCGPAAVVAGGDGALYVADHPFQAESDERDDDGDGDEDARASRAGCAVLRRIDVASGAVVTFAGSGSDEGEVDGQGPSARFDGPVALAWAGGRLYVADEGGSAIRRVDVADHAVTTIARERDGIGAPDGLVADGAGGLLIADGSGALRRLDLESGGLVTVRLTNGAALVHPSGIALWRQTLVVTDAAENVLLKGHFSGVYGRGPPDSSSATSRGLSR